MIKEIKEIISMDILPKYSSFCNHIDLEFTNSYTHSKFIHFKPTLCLKSLSDSLCPKEFMNLKYEIYKTIETCSNKKAILVDEWELTSKYEN